MRHRDINVAIGGGVHKILNVLSLLIQRLLTMMVRAQQLLVKFVCHSAGEIVNTVFIAELLMARSFVLFLADRQL